MGQGSRLIRPRTVTGDADGLVSHAGLVWLAETADRSGLTAGMYQGRATSRRGPPLMVAPSQAHTAHWVQRPLLARLLAISSDQTPSRADTYGRKATSPVPNDPEPGLIEAPDKGEVTSSTLVSPTAKPLVTAPGVFQFWGPIAWC